MLSSNNPQYDVTHSYSKLCGDVTGASSCVLWVKVRSEAAHKAGFENVSTATVGEETTLIQVHLLPRRLEVQSHWTAHRKAKWVTWSHTWSTHMATGHG